MLLNLINGTGVYNVPVVGSQVTQGKCFFVAPGTGSDGNDGLTPDRPVKSLKKALALCTANQNDTVFLLAQSNTSSATTNYVEDVTGLVWNKDLCHIIGVGNSSMTGQRARIAGKSGTVFTAPLVTVSANACTFSNISIFFGVAATTATSIGALLVTGLRNKFVNCSISGIGADEMDVTGAYSLKLSAAEENVFENCHIGLDTIARGTAVNTEIVFASASKRNIFKGCIIETYCEAAGHTFVTAGAGSQDRFNLFKGCVFINPINSAATSMTEAFTVTAPTGGTIIVDNCSMVGAALWETSSGASTEVQMIGVAKLAAQTGGIGFATA